MRRVTAILCFAIICFSLLGSACNKKDERQRVPGSDAYSCVTYDLPVKEGYDAVFSRIFLNGEYYYISALYSRYSEELKDYEIWTDIFTVDFKGNTVFAIEFPGNQLPSAVTQNEYAYIGVDSVKLASMENPDITKLDNEAVFLDKKTGEVTKRIEVSFHANFIVPINDGFVIGGSNELAKYSSDGSLRKMIHTDYHISYKNAFFVDAGHFYVVEDKDESTFVYHEVNFEDGTSTILADTIDIGADISGFCGKYFFNQNGEYKVELNTMQVAKLADWNCVDIRPQKKSIRQQNEYYALDDNHFARRYSYSDGTCELLLFTYDRSIDVTNREKITIGGYGVYSDLALQWVVYNFNISNDKYRAVLEDYSLQFAGSTAEEMRRAKLNLMKYFNEGNTPDIFYGDFFDYDYMGRIGMVADLRSYIDNNDELTNSLTETSRNLMLNNKGNCYQLFASYWLNGYEGLSRQFPQGTNIDIFQLYSLSKETGIPIKNSRIDVASTIVEWAFAYDFAELWGVYTGQKKITKQQIAEILEIAVEAQSEASLSSNDDDANYLRDEVCLIEGTSLGDFYGFAESLKQINEDIVFVGFPSVEKSVHLAMPNCCLAISTSAKNPDKCWELCQGLFSEQVQKIVAVNGDVPINQNVLDMIIQAVLTPQSVTDDIIKSYVYDKKPADEKIVDAYIKTVCCADTLAAYDWGIFAIIIDEVESYYTQQRDIMQIAETLDKRLDLYAQENYQ